MDPAEAHLRFEGARVARLATTDADGRPHLVPVTFALEGDTIYTAVDHKPKRTRALKRLANVVANPRVALLVDQYHDDWARLWWARADGAAQVHENGLAQALDLLCARYAQYSAQPPGGPVIEIAVERWSGWRA